METIIILVITLILGVLRNMMIPDTILPYVAADPIDRPVYYFLSFNQFIQWCLFSVLYILKYRYYKHIANAPAAAPPADAEADE